MNEITVFIVNNNYICAKKTSIEKFLNNFYRQNIDNQG